MEATLFLAQRSSSLFNVIDGPVVAPARFISQRMPDLVEIHDTALNLLQRLKAEGREHGITFAAPEVRTSFFKFVECCNSIEKWTLGALKLSEGREGSQAGTGSCDVQDVQESYAAFHENSQLFFVSECTLFDPRIQRRILMPVYFGALRDHNRQLFKEVERLRLIDATIRPSIEGRGGRLIFRPTIGEFQFLYESLQMYLAVSILEDDITTTTYFRILLDSLQKEARDVSNALSLLPQAGEHAHLERKNHASPATVGIGSGANVTPPPDATTLLEPGEPARFSRRPSASSPAFTEVEIQKIEHTLSVFDDVRHKVSELCRTIQNDISAKNSTHKTRVPGGSRASTSSHSASDASGAMRGLTQQQRQQQSTSWWQSVASAAGSLFRGVTDVVTCNAEVFASSDDFDADGAPLTSTSPMAHQKKLLEQEATLLYNALDAVADGLELEYPQLYQKDWKRAVQKHAARVFSKLESMTVVFAGET